MTTKRDEPDCMRALYQGWTTRMTANPEMGLEDLRSMFDEWHQATGEPEGVTYADGVVGGVSGIWCTPLDGDPKKVVLYAHGGGFALGSAASHRKFAAHLAKSLGGKAFVLDYGRCPARLRDDGRPRPRSRRRAGAHRPVVRKGKLTISPTQTAPTPAKRAT